VEATVTKQGWEGAVHTVTLADDALDKLWETGGHIAGKISHDKMTAALGYPELNKTSFVRTKNSNGFDAIYQWHWDEQAWCYDD
jgi:hypothetical protein